MSLPPRKPGDEDYVAIRCLIANIHKPKNVSMPPSMLPEPGPPLEAVQESPPRSEAEPGDQSESERSDDNLDEDLTPQKRKKSNSFGGSVMLAPPAPVQHAKRRRSFLPLQLGGAEHAGPLSAGPQLTVPKFTVTAPPGEQRRFSHGFVGAFHGFALRRHSNTVRPNTVASVECCDNNSY